MKRDVPTTYQQWHRQYGDKVSLVTGPYRLFMFFHPDDVHELLVGNAKSLIRLPRVMKTLEQWNGSSLLVLEGQPWARQRRLVSPAFQPRRLEGYGAEMVRETTRLLESWRPRLEANGHLDVEIDQAMTRLSLAIICRTLFDCDVAELADEIKHSVAVLSDVAFDEVQAPFRWPLWLPTAYNRRKRAAMRCLDEFVRGLVRTRRQEGVDHGDLLSMLLTAVDEEGAAQSSSSPDAIRLTDEQVRNELMTLLLAGHDTTAAALDWLWCCLARDAEVTERCVREVQSVLGTEPPTTTCLPQLPCLTAAIKESLRLYPAAIGLFLRQCTSDIAVGGQRIPARSLLAVSSFVTQRDPRWFPDPERFDPSRFLDGKDKQLPACSYFPFGVGPRVCIGQTFALTEITLVAATLLQSLTPTTVPGEEAMPGWELKMALRPQPGARVRWLLRSRSA
ncbi:MAG: cytochrome P450 [Planctomycetales bacterium]|nr:cytochrome P450 [Planctomycetales bacterium]